MTTSQRSVVTGYAPARIAHGTLTDVRASRAT
jgi:hypothetical protein